MQLIDIKLFSPEIILIFGSIFILLYGIFFKKTKIQIRIFYILALFSLVISFYCSIYVSRFNTTSFNNLLINDLIYTFF